MRIGFHCSHEQYSPAELLRLVERAEAAGFDGAMCSDHLAPFSMRQGSSGFAWSWLGAAMARAAFSFGTVTAPGQRYHPVIVAQAIATLGNMFPGRLWVAMGSGQLINEQAVSDTWPLKADRNARLQECAAIIRRLLRGETVTHDGYVQAREARIFVAPGPPPPIFVAATSPETATWGSRWADGLITVYQPAGRLAEVVRSFREEAGQGKPVVLQAQHSYARDLEEARSGAWSQWRFSVLPSQVTTDLRTPEQIDAATSDVPLEQVLERVRTSAEPAEHAEWLREYEALGFNEVYVHNVNRRQEDFIDDFGAHVIPRLRAEPSTGRGG